MLKNKFLQTVLFRAYHIGNVFLQTSPVYISFSRDVREPWRSEWFASFSATIPGVRSLTLEKQSASSPSALNYELKRVIVRETMRLCDVQFYKRRNRRFCSMRNLGSCRPHIFCITQQSSWYSVQELSFLAIIYLKLHEKCSLPALNS